ncbi:MAG TPA: iron-sulfur cluster assembly accessory protein [Thermoanaerobaculia bacterium]|nr:iron-sulfur cluster assembly accessory protein [Thermoanaerobaculia bacterium]
MEPTAQTETPSPEPRPAAEVPVAITEKAVRMVMLTREEEGLDPSAGLRVAVRGGGCSGFEYALDFDTEERESDHVYRQGELKVLVDALSARYLKGTTIDYAMGAQGAGFKFHNPNAVGSCGCGSSFAV